MKNTLKLVLTDQWYDITGTNQKMMELRENSKYIRSRLLNKDGTFRHYDFIELQKAYRKNAEKKIYKITKIYQWPNACTYYFLNNITAKFGINHFVIEFQQIK